MSLEKLFEVYLHRCTISGKGYVGITCQGIRSRLYNHESEARQGSEKPFHRALRKYGIAAFETTVLASGLARDEAFEAEQHWIEKLGTFADGYNATRGGEGPSGVKLSAKRKAEISAFFKILPRTDQHRRRISESLTGRAPNWASIDKMADLKRGVKQSPERAAKSRDALAKASAAWKGQKLTPESIQKIKDAKARLYSINYPDGRNALLLTTIRQLAAGTGISHSGVAKAIKLGRPISKPCALQGWLIKPFTETAMTMVGYRVALADPSGPFA